MPFENKRAELAIKLNHVLLTQGITSPTMGSLAHSIGISRASLYTYFRNKDAIVEAVVARHLHFASLNPIPTSFVAEQFPKVLLDSLLFAGSTTERFLTELRLAYPTPANDLAQAQTQRRDQWREYLLRAQRAKYLVDDTIASVDFMMFHMEHAMSAILEAATHKDIDLLHAEEYLQNLVNTLLRGFVAAPEPALKLLAEQGPYEQRILQEFRDTYGRV
ncbi:MAG: TetR/AcrR family transcriptional regulator [Bifidobacteriaceae bacterium]|jgi:AcrR family transcriptional regulator|nr:TetR/AcrR family transcriptional regulator [Bifidobacteriaceae bacterium]